MFLRAGVLAFGMAALSAFSGCAEAAVPPHPVIAHAQDPFETRDATGPRATVMDIVGIRAVHNRRSATMEFRMRLGRPVPERPDPPLHFGFFANTPDSDSQREAAEPLGVAVKTNPFRASYSVNDGPDVPVAFSLSSDRKLLRVRVTDQRLGAGNYTYFGAGAGDELDPNDLLDSDDPEDLGPDHRFEHVATFFSLPLRRLSARLRAGRLTVTSVTGAHVTVIIRRNGRRPTTVRYRHSATHTSDKRLFYRFSCRGRASYKISIRARDRYGSRRSTVLSRRC
jgi:hypothetical protein